MSSDPEKPKRDEAAPAADPGSGTQDDAAPVPIDAGASTPAKHEVVIAPVEPDLSPAASGSIDVAMSGRHPVTSEMASAASGSIDVAVSSTHLPAVEFVGRIDKPADGTPIAISDIDSKPIASGAVAVVVARETTGRTKRLSAAAIDVVSGGVSKLGTGIGTIGEGVSMLGEKSKNVPLVGSSVSALGESITSVGESLTELPRVAGTRRGRLLVRSLFVGFMLVGAWIAVIVALQLRGGTDQQIDFRPYAEKILIEISNGPESIAAVYEKASPRFQEFVEKERFVDNMTDLHATVGKFKEISAVNDTLVTRGPNGRVGRVSLTVTYERGKTKASVSLHFHEGQWKLLGIGVEIPPEVKITQREREKRVKICDDPMDPKKCDIYVAANAILENLRDNRGAQVWDDALPIFQKQEEKARWVQIQQGNQQVLGGFRRIIAVTEQRQFTSGNAIYDVLLEYTRANGVRAVFGFARASKQQPWKLTSLKIVVPLPRADEGEPPKPFTESPTGNPPLVGSGSAPEPAGSGSARPPTGSAKPAGGSNRPKQNGSGKGSGSSNGSDGASSGSAANGSAASGSAASGGAANAANGSAASGSASTNNPVSGSAASGSASNGSAANGSGASN